MRYKKYYTVKEWQKFYKIQEILCEKYEIILTNHTTKREQVISILKQINLKNIDKGISAFNKLIQQFGGSMEQLTRDLDEGKGATSNVKIWLDTPKIYSQNQDQKNLERIWGKK
jgi:hypothetical protein